MLQITPVRTQPDAADVRLLVSELRQWLGQRYPDHTKALADYFEAQATDLQMHHLLRLYSPPKADCLLARVNGEAAGVVMVKPKAAGICELNHMYVRDTARRQGTGRALVTGIMETARGLGYRRMILSAGIRHSEAIPLYQAMGFAPDASLPGTFVDDIAVNMARDL